MLSFNMNPLFRNSEKVTKIVTALNLKIPTRDLKSKDTRHLLSLIFSQWLSLSTCIIQTVIDIVPAPSVAQVTRVPKMLYPNLYEPTVEPKNKLEQDLFASRSDPSAFVIAYVSKMFAVSQKQLPDTKTATEATSEVVPEDSQASSSPPLEAPKETFENVEVLLGFARLYSGIIRTGTIVYAVLPKFNAALAPFHPHNVKHVVSATVEGLYIMMGRELVGVDCVRAGNIFAIKGLEGKVWRSATLCAPGEAGISDSPGPIQLEGCLTNLGGINRSVRRY
jgi:ribosome assembly protein 1